MTLALLLPAGAGAQTNATKAPVPHDQIVSANPFGLMLKWINGEYERKVSPATTVGLSASYFTDLDFADATALARWYPQGAALDGFYLGARVGAYGFKTREYDYAPYPPGRTNAIYPTDPTIPSYPPYPTYRERVRVVPGAGLEIGYNWLLGSKRNVNVGIGFGLTRLIGDVRYEVPTVLPNIRLVNIGVAF